MANQKLKLNREQLATFLKSHEQIKQFEKLFQVADDVSGETDTVGISIQAANGETKANQALSEIKELRDLLDIVATQPKQTHEEFSEVMAWLATE